MPKMARPETTSHNRARVVHLGLPIVPDLAPRRPALYTRPPSEGERFDNCLRSFKSLYQMYIDNFHRFYIDFTLTKTNLDLSPPTWEDPCSFRGGYLRFIELST